MSNPADQVRFVLVAPTHPGNIGASARAIKTMGFSRLVVVQPRHPDYREHPDAVALATGVYTGRPMPRHMNLPVDAAHFDRWLALFEETAEQLCTPLAARHFVTRARNIAESLELGVANRNGVLLGVGERYRRRD